MSQSRYLLKKFTLIPNGTSLKEPYEVKAGFVSFDYFESIESPTISATYTFIDLDSVISRLGITGGEFVEIDIQDGDEDKFKITAKHNMMINSVKGVVQDGNKEIATLELISIETITNETARLNKKFTGNISQTVEEILTKDKKGIQTKKKLFKDESANSYSFIGNLKRPFDTIQWLCPKTQSPKSFGFLFYENLDGYHFKSIEGLFDQDAYRYQKTDRPLIDDGKILENKLEQSNDIGMNCRMGMYANKTIYVDIENQEAEVIDFDLDQLKDLKKPAKAPKGFAKKPTRLMLRASDAGALQKGSVKDETEPQNSLAVYQNKSYIRNNLLFSQSFMMSIPVNTKLRVGELIDVKLPLKRDTQNPANRFGNDKTNDPSGIYLIAELRHTLSRLGNRKVAQTTVRLIRNVFTAPDKPVK